MIRRNILANALGGTWVTLLSLLVIPVQAKLLGVEAYGLISFLTSLQIISSVLDLGLSVTVIREVAVDTSDRRAFSRSMIQTINTVYWALGAVLALTVALSAPWIAGRWLDLGNLEHDSAVSAIQLGAVAIGFRWPVALYTGILSGLQRMAELNKLKSLTATVRQAGGIVVLVVWPELTIFMAWLVLASVLEILLYARVCAGHFPGTLLRPGISKAVIERVWRFALDVNLISVTAIIFTQSDRLLIGLLLPLEDLGFYSIAYNAALGLSILQGFITTAVLPAVSSDHAQGRISELHARAAKATQSLIYLLTLPTMIFVFFGAQLLTVWISSDVATRSSVALGVLAAGFLLNAAASIPYTVALATGNTRLPLMVNIIGLVFYLPMLHILISRWGIEGAALAWLGLNLYYFVVLLPMLQRRVFHETRISRWIRCNVLELIAVGTVTFAAGLFAVRMVAPASLWFALFVCSIASGIYLAGGYSVLQPALRSDITRALKHSFGFVHAPRG